MAQLLCRDVVLGYEGRAVVQHLNFEVNEGDYLCIVGENGSGKSTLIKALLGLKSPMSGEIRTGDGLEADGIGYLPQQTVVQKDFPASVQEIVLSGCLGRFGWRPFYGKKEKNMADRQMERLGITHLSKRCYRELSGGQQQRVLLARALCATRTMLLLDEPVAGLDPVAVQEMYELLEELNREEKITVLMVSHDIRAAVTYADHILHISEQPLFFGTKEDYVKSEVGRSYLSVTGVTSVFELLGMYFQYPFVRYAFLVGVLIAFSSSLLGVSLVLKRFSFIGDGLSHVAFGAMAVATVLDVSHDTAVVLPITVGAAILLLRTGQNAKLQGDAAIAMISVGALALGYLFLNIFSKSANLTGDVCSTLFGSTAILTLSRADVWLCVILSAAVVLLFTIFYHRIFAVTFDETFARATGVETNRYNLLIAVVTASVIVLAMKLVGSLLISALIIFPALSAMRIFKSFRGVIGASAFLSVFGAALGIFLSILASTPVGATIVCVDLVLFAVCCLIGTGLGR